MSTLIQKDGSAMPRPMFVLLLLILILAGGAWFLASGVKQVPTAPVEEEVQLNAA